jgi:hypothetical protein
MEILDYKAGKNSINYYITTNVVVYNNITNGTQHKLGGYCECGTICSPDLDEACPDWKVRPPYF